MLKPEDMKAQAGEAAGFLKSLANPNRLMILCLLSQGELCVSNIQAHLDISQTALSQHLARLREEGIVTYRRDHRTLYYSILSPHVAEIVTVLYNIYCPKKD